MKNVKNNSKQIKRNKGITLITLVVTIVVLIILAGVSITLLLGENGIITKAQQAKKKNHESTAEENVKLEVQASFDKNGKINLEQAKENLKEKLGAVVEVNKNDTLKVTYNGEEFLVDQNNNVLKIELPKDLKVGDVISYTPKTQEYLWEAKYSGNGTDIKMNNTTNEYSITKWKVLNINNDGTIDLIAEKPTEGTVPLAYAQGYNNCVKLLNDACNQLYGNKELGIFSRSINEEDIKDKMTSEALNSIKDSGTDSPILCEEQIETPFSSKDSYFPSIYANEKLSTINGLKNENGLERSEQEKFIEEDNAITNAESIQPYQTYWYRDHKNTEKMFKNVEKEPSIQYYNLLMPNGYATKYWLASRCIHVNQNVNNNTLNCYFAIRTVFWRNK